MRKRPALFKSGRELAAPGLAFQALAKLGEETAMSFVTVERRGGAAVVTYANPPIGTMTAAGAQEMLDKVRPLAADPAVRSILLTGGVPGIFVRHYDVGELSTASDATEGAPAPPPPPPGARPEQGFLALVDLLAEAPKPVVAAINGLCMGGGFEMSLACDLRIAARDGVQIGLPETRVGIFPGGGGTQRLPRVVGESKALEIILRGLVVEAEEALRIGLVHELADDPLARALEMAAEWDQRGAEGIAFAKRLTRAALSRPLDEGLADERRSFAQVMRTASAREGLRSARPPAEIQKV
ncbi:MAG: enoyl-CoA hydratase/isomerase family protein [Phenylobacterium sp.]|nr:MAG: enoyl-CoA hydratase/isomerase family protein [Phenylobacterium sp.]